MKRFEGKTALITGAAQGIGRGIALCLAEEGANIVVNDCANVEQAEEVVRAVKAMGQEAIFWQADVSDREAVAAMFAGVVAQFGRIDVVVSLLEVLLEDLEGFLVVLELHVAVGDVVEHRVVRLGLVRLHELCEGGGEVVGLVELHALVEVHLRGFLGIVCQGR